MADRNVCPTFARGVIEMPAPICTECPEPAQLRRLINSTLPPEEQSQLTAHLDCCEMCQKAIEHIAAGGSGLLDCACRADDVRPEDTSAYWPALRKLEREVMRPTVLAATAASGDWSFPEVSLDFLDPAEEPGTLGKLGRFHVVEIIGQGGMGIVLRAHDECLERQVALKVLDPRYVKNDLARNRFIREARAAASITHENVVAVHHVEKHREQIPFLVMRLVTGESLQDRLETSKGPLELREILRIGKQMAAGLAAAHEQTLIHRDIKPANILLESGTGRVLLTDFGLARAAEDVKLTQTGFVAGTPLYMSPEQARGEPLDHRSDLFSLGGVLYSMCSGAPPFEGSSPFVVLRAVTEAKHRNLQELNPDVPDELAAVIDSLLAKNPDERIQSAAEVAELLTGIEAKLPKAKSADLSKKRTIKLRAVPSWGWWGRYGQWIGVAVLAANALLFLTELTKATQWTLLGQRGRTDAAKPSLDPRQPGPTELSNGPKPLAEFDAGAGPIWGIAMSPDASWLAAALDDGTLRIWDVKAGKIKRVAAHKGSVWSIASNHDGSMIATAGEDGLVKLWDPHTGKDIDWMDLHTPIRSLAFSADGARIATGTRNGAVRVWDTATRKIQVVTQYRHDRAVTAVAFSSDGLYLASASEDHTVKIWDLSDDEGREINIFSDHNGGVHAVAFHPNRKVVATGGWDRTIRLWDIDQGKQIGKLDGQSADIRSIAYSPDGSRIVFATDGGHAHVWDPTAGTTVRRLNWNSGIITGMALARDGSKVATAHRDGTVGLWNIPD